MTGITLTPNLKLSEMPANFHVWAQLMNNNLIAIDAAISGFIVFNNLRGAWTNSTAYAVGDTVVDPLTAVIWQCQVANTSSVIPTTFAQARALFPTFWTVYSAPAKARGAWTGPGTSYALNDFVVSGSQYAVCIAAHVSSATFAADLALSRWSVLVDLSSAGSLVLPILGGATDANKFVITNPAGNAYQVAAMSAALLAGGASTLGISLLTAASQAAARTALGEGTVSPFNVGTAAQNIPQLDGSARLPAVNGSQLIGMNTLIQEVATITGARISTGTATVMPFDATTPQITEGDQYITAIITPISALSKLEIYFQGNFAIGTTVQIVGIALFRDAVAGALAAQPYLLNGTAASQSMTMALTYEMVAGGTSPITFRIRAGTNGSPISLVFNSLDGTADLYGGVCPSMLRIREYQP